METSKKYIKSNDPGKKGYVRDSESPLVKPPKPPKPNKPLNS